MLCLLYYLTKYITLQTFYNLCLLSLQQDEKHMQNLPRLSIFWVSTRVGVGGGYEESKRWGLFDI